MVRTLETRGNPSFQAKRGRGEGVFKVWRRVMGLYVDPRKSQKLSQPLLE
jgi:hypothetical protein